MSIGKSISDEDEGEERGKTLNTKVYSTFVGSLLCYNVETMSA